MRSRSGTRTLGLCALLVGLLVIPASAQASGKWMDEETNIEGTTTRAVEGSLENNHGVLLSKIAKGLELKLECKEANLVNAILEKEGKISQGTTKGKVKSIGCVVENGGEATACEPHSVGSPGGTIETAALHALEEVVGGEPAVKLLPNTGTTFVNVEMGEECAFGEEVPITGWLVFFDCEKKAEVSQSVHLIVERSGLATLFAMAHAAFIDDSLLVKLADGHPWRWLLI